MWGFALKLQGVAQVETGMHILCVGINGLRLQSQSTTGRLNPGTTALSPGGQKTGLFRGLCRGLANCVFSLCPHMVVPLCMCFLISSSYKVTTSVGLRSIHVTSFQLHPLFKDSLSKYELRPWGLGLEHTNLGER